MSNLMVAKSEEMTRSRFSVEPPWTPPANTKIAVYTGAVEDWVVPVGVTLVHIECWGAQGGDSYSTAGETGEGGWGGYVMADYTVTPGETLKLRVGQMGARAPFGGTFSAFNGGGLIQYNEYGNMAGNPGGGGGGGATDVRQGGDALGNRIIVAGGGAGAGISWAGNAQNNKGGHGGGLTGEAGYASQPAPNGSVRSNLLGFGGQGGSQVAGGAAGTPPISGTAATAGAAGVGGVGQYSNSSTVNNSGSGGGGYFGGGGGTFVNGSGGYSGSAGGGGGSSFIGSGFGTTVNTQGLRTGNGIMRITW